MQERQRLDKGPTEEAHTSIKRHIKWLNEEIAQVEEAHQAAVKNNASLAASAALYQSVPGVGERTVATLVGSLPALGHWSGKALVGLAPWANDSGRQQGYRSIRGGRGAVRKVLYLAALAAIRYNDDLKQFYQRLRARGKTGKVAVVAVMRKLLLLNAIAQRGTPWVEHHTPLGNKKA